MYVLQADPEPHLGEWIHSFRQYRFTEDDGADFTLYPGTGAELWIILSGHLRHAGLPLGDGVVCLRSRRLVLKQAGLRVFSMRIRAGALPLFAEQPLIDLIDRYTPMNALWSDFSGLSLIRQIGRCPDFDEQCRLAEALLSSRLHHARRLEHMQTMAALIYENSADFSLGDYAGELECNRSHLSRQFRETQGVSAKYFHRLCRFERFLRTALYTPQGSLADLALDHGYYDQAHMHHDVRRITSLAPRILLGQGTTRLFYAPRRKRPPQKAL